MISIPARIYSPMIWETIRYRTKEYRDFYSFDTKMEYPATVGEYTANMLRRLAFFFKVREAVEIGTYIGRSTLALAEGMGKGVIHTCDSETELFLQDSWQGVAIKRHHCISTDMLRTLHAGVDFMFFDGRIQHEDVEYIAHIATPDCVMAFDDFEGVEKGVANALMIQHLGGILVYPEQGQTLGMMIRKVGFVRQ